MAVLAVLLITGLAVNRVVSRSLEAELSAAQRDRITVVAGAISDVDLTKPRVRLGIEVVLRRVATTTRGRVQLVAADGTPVIDVGTRSARPGHRDDRAADPQLEREAADRGAARGPRVPAGLQPDPAGGRHARDRGGGRDRAVLSSRLTQPLRGVAAAAQRLGHGDLSARARGGPDRESSELAGAFNAMAERVQRSEMLRRRAASDMAHDLATPATVLESQLQAMVDGVVPADREQLDRARAAAGALSGVIVQLGELVDAESAVPLQRRQLEQPLGELLVEVRSAMEPLFRERGVGLAVDEVAASVRVEVDPTQVGRALRNVLGNAAQHSPSGAPCRSGSSHWQAR